MLFLILRLFVGLSRKKTAPNTELTTVPLFFLMQVKALREYPVVATALAAAVAAIHDRRDPEPALQQVRHLLNERSTVIDTIPRWSWVS